MVVLKTEWYEEKPRVWLTEWSDWYEKIDTDVDDNKYVMPPIGKIRIHYETNN